MRIPGFMAEASLGLSNYLYIGATGVLAESIAAIPQQSSGQSCNLTCFKHSCSINCAPGEKASCNCRQFTTPTGWQWLPVCECK